MEGILQSASGWLPQATGIMGRMVLNQRDYPYSSGRPAIVFNEFFMKRSIAKG
jgi:hypothetical protein